jgi:hypothetical protein
MSQYPGYPDQPPPAPSAGPYQPQAQNGVGLAAMIVGIASFVLFAPLSSIVAVSLGVVGLGKARKGTATNRGQALAGVICGAISLVLGVVFIVVFVVRSHA